MTQTKLPDGWQEISLNYFQGTILGETVDVFFDEDQECWCWKINFGKGKVGDCMSIFDNKDDREEAVSLISILNSGFSQSTYDQLEFAEREIFDHLRNTSRFYDSHWQVKVAGIFRYDLLKDGDTYLSGTRKELIEQLG
jgi:hypothetical protein